MIDFDWDLNWIKEQFGEIPSGVDYQQNILQVLSDIQSDHGDYFIERQDIQREMRHKRAFIEDIAKTYPNILTLKNGTNMMLAAYMQR